MKRYFFSLVIAAIFASIPYFCVWVAGNEYARGELSNDAFVVSVFLFVIAWFASYTYPAWSGNNDN